MSVSSGPGRRQSRYFLASGVSAERTKRDPYRDLRDQSRAAHETELALRSEIARLEREVHRLNGELAHAWGRAREPLPAGSTRHLPPVALSRFALAPFPHGLPSQRRRPA